ncbi:MAG: FoF1 ATP synthase subunit a [Eubacteriales bacterium]
MGKGFAPEIAVKRFNILGLSISETVVTAYCVTLALVAFALIVRFLVVPKFKERPTKLQNVLELVVDGINRFANNTAGDYGSKVAAYGMTLAFFLVVSGLLELITIRAPGTDINFTIAISLMSFLLINTLALMEKGIGGRIKHYLKPNAVIGFFRLLSDLVMPVSLSCRMFGNLLSGLVVMELVYYAMGNFAVGIPAALSVFFNIFHVLMQTYVFLMLTFSFVHEATE